ncbi:MAG: hypothetical protein ACP5KS_07645, partial [Candidatus Hydrogenedens sp.]
FLRVISGVTVWKAMVNSPWIITCMLTIYYMYFIYCRCKEISLSRLESMMKAIQIGLMAFIAFLPLRPDFDLYKNIPQYRNVIYALLSMKVFFWLFLLTIVVFYYLNGSSIFKRLPDLFVDFYSRNRCLTKEKIEETKQDSSESIN